MFRLFSVHVTICIMKINTIIAVERGKTVRLKISPPLWA